jgi:hypothetical protein
MPCVETDSGCGSSGCGRPAGDSHLGQTVPYLLLQLGAPRPPLRVRHPRPRCRRRSAPPAAAVAYCRRSLGRGRWRRLAAARPGSLPGQRRPPLGATRTGAAPAGAAPPAAAGCAGGAAASAQERPARNAAGAAAAAAAGEARAVAAGLGLLLALSRAAGLGQTDSRVELRVGVLKLIDGLASQIQPFLQLCSTLRLVECLQGGAKDTDSVTS